MQRQPRSPQSDGPFIALAEGLAARFGSDKRVSAASAASAERQLRNGGLSARKRLALVQIVMRGGGVGTRNKETALGLALHHLQMVTVSKPATRLALVEAALRITDYRTTSAAPWLRELSAIYLKLRDDGVVPDWQLAFGLDSEEVLRYCASIRESHRYPPFVAPVPPRAVPQVTAPSLPTGVSSPLRVSRITLDGFRAAPTSIELDLTERGKPCSVVIFGDNGVGKSTLVNAIELACQGTVGRQVPALANDGMRLINLSAPRQQAEVSVTLTGGSRLHRTVERVNELWRVSGSVTPFDFSLSPLTLQRADLVRFLATPGTRRGQLFVGQFAAEGTEGSVRAVQQRVKTAKAARHRFVEDIAGRAGHPFHVGIGFVLPMLSTLHLDGVSEAQWTADRGSLPRAYLDDKSRYQQLEQELTEAKRLAKHLPRNELENHALQVKRLGELLGDIDVSLTDALVAVTGYTFIEQVEVVVGGSAALGLQMTVKLKNGNKLAPEQIFSEGVQDLLAILFFIEVAKAAALRGQAKVLILDDVIQSVDATIRRRLLQQILTDLKSWQLIITCHDRLWLGHVRESLQKAHIPYCDVTIRSWDFVRGPLISTVKADASTDLRNLIRQANPRTVAGAAGLLLETLCNHLSWTLPASVTRVKGDLYTLGALWGSVTSKAKNSPELRPQFDEIDRIVSLRNQMGAHYNEVADSIADSEADLFGDLVLRLWEAVFCQQCGEYVVKEASKTYSCCCGAVQFTT